MKTADAYVMLMASLPRAERPFLAKQPPISRLRLDRRLLLLTPEDRALVREIETALDWRSIPIDATDAVVLARAERVLARLDSATLRGVIRDRLEIRTIVAALRRRARGGAPPTGRRWGEGRLRRIAQSWREPGLGLDRIVPWAAEADRLLRQPDPEALERLILEASFKALQRRAAGHAFDLEAVVIYVLKWAIVDRWASQNREAAARRFDTLTEDGLKACRALELPEAA
jgi:hypothetical protein